MNIQYYQMVEISCKRDEMAKACEYVEKFGYKVQTIVYEASRLRMQAIKKGTRGEITYAEDVRIDGDMISAAKVEPSYVFD